MPPRKVLVAQRKNDSSTELLPTGRDDSGDFVYCQDVECNFTTCDMQYPRYNYYI